jgi:hypothetical protein
MASLSISRAWEETKARIAADGRLVAVVAAALLLLPQAIATVAAPPEMLSGERPPGWFNLMILIVAFLGLIGEIAIIALATGSRISVGEAMLLGLRRFLPALGAAFATALAVAIIAIPLLILVVGVSGLEMTENSTAPAQAVLTAALLVVVLGVLIGARMLMVLPVAASESGGPVRVLKRAWALGKGHYLRFLAFTVLIAIAALVVAYAAQVGIGSIIALLFAIKPMSIGALLYGLLFGTVQAVLAAIASVMLARIYVQVSGDSPGVSVPKSGT